MSSADRSEKLTLPVLLAHELEAPLLSIELELRSLLDRAPCREAASRALDQVLDLRELSRSLVALSEEKLTRERFALEPVLGRLYQRFLPIARARGAVLVREETGVEAEGDPVATERCVSNLIDNAVKFSPSGGRVRIDAAVRGGVVAVTVEDEGPGLEDDARDRVFEPFFRVDRDAPGWGLGLALARRLAELQEGRLLVESAPGEGSRFTLELPAP